MNRGLNVGDLDKETRDKLGIKLSPSAGQAGARHISLGKVLKAIDGLEEEDMLWVLYEAKIAHSQQGKVEPDNTNGHNYTAPLFWTVEVVARSYGVSLTEMTGRMRPDHVVLARQVAMYVLWSTQQYTLAQIGDALGGRTPATVSHGFGNIAELLSTDNRLKEKVESIQEELSQ